MQKITSDSVGPLVITGSANLVGSHVGLVTVSEDAELKVTGEITGDVIIMRRGTLMLMGRIKGAVRNEGGAVDIFGFVGRVMDVGDTETYVCRGAIIGGKRASKPGKLSSMS